MLPSFRNIQLNFGCALQYCQLANWVSNIVWRCGWVAPNCFSNCCRKRSSSTAKNSPHLPKSQVLLGFSSMLFPLVIWFCTAMLEAWGCPRLQPQMLNKSTIPVRHAKTQRRLLLPEALGLTCGVGGTARNCATSQWLSLTPTARGCRFRLPSEVFIIHYHSITPQKLDYIEDLSLRFVIPHNITHRFVAALARC